jgi:peptidoglycan hydrolase-like protein with peptidoglycan-binding domain
MSNSDIQGNLNILGASPPLTVDGQLGPMSVAAIKAFQTAHGLTADGIAGPQTKTAIYIAIHTS